MGNNQPSEPVHDTLQLDGIGRSLYSMLKVNPTKGVYQSNYHKLFHLIRYRDMIINTINYIDKLSEKINRECGEIVFPIGEHCESIEYINNKLKEYDDEINHLIIIETGHRFYELV